MRLQGLFRFFLRIVEKNEIVGGRNTPAQFNFRIFIYSSNR